jgi:hypothetical protein
MSRGLTRLTTALVAACMLGASTGCTGSAVMVGPQPRQGYSVDRTVRGSSCGLLLFGFLPLMVNSRTQRAYDAATAGTMAGITDTRIRHSWAVIPGAGLLLCTDIEGKVLQ